MPDIDIMTMNKPQEVLDNIVTIPALLSGYVAYRHYGQAVCPTCPYARIANDPALRDWDNDAHITIYCEKGLHGGEAFCTAVGFERCAIKLAEKEYLRSQRINLPKFEGV